MNLQELKHRIHKWVAYYNDRGIPLKHVHVVNTIHEDWGDSLIEVEQDNIQHGKYTARDPDYEVKGGYKGELYFISLHQFNPDNGMDKDLEDKPDAGSNSSGS